MGMMGCTLPVLVTLLGTVKGLEGNFSIFFFPFVISRRGVGSSVNPSQQTTFAKQRAFVEVFKLRNNQIRWLSFRIYIKCL